MGLLLWVFFPLAASAQIPDSIAGPLTSLARLSDNDSWVMREGRNSERSTRAALKAAGIRKGMLDDEPFVSVESSSEATALTKMAEDFGVRPSLFTIGSVRHYMVRICTCSLVRKHYTAS